MVHSVFLLLYVNQFWFQVSITINELAAAAGIRCDVDPALCQALASATKVSTDIIVCVLNPDSAYFNAINRFQNESPDEEHKLACLLMVFLAVSIPVLARDEGSIFLPEYGAHQNSCHCIAFAVNRVAAAIFTVTKGNIQERLTEFLAVSGIAVLNHMFYGRFITYIINIKLVWECSIGLRITNDMVIDCHTWVGIIFPSRRIRRYLWVTNCCPLTVILMVRSQCSKTYGRPVSVTSWQEVSTDRHKECLSRLHAIPVKHFDYLDIKKCVYFGNNVGFTSIVCHILGKISDIGLMNYREGGSALAMTHWNCYGILILCVCNNKQGHSRPICQNAHQSHRSSSWNSPQSQMSKCEHRAILFFSLLHQVFSSLAWKPIVPAPETGIPFIFYLSTLWKTHQSSLWTCWNLAFPMYYYEIRTTQYACSPVKLTLPGRRRRIPSQLILLWMRDVRCKQLCISLKLLV